MVVHTVAALADFEEDRPKVLAPPDAYRWLGLVALTREAGENVKVLKQRLSEFEAQDAGETTTKEAPCTPRRTAMPSYTCCIPQTLFNSPLTELVQPQVQRSMRRRFLSTKSHICAACCQSSQPSQ